VLTIRNAHTVARCRRSLLPRAGTSLVVGGATVRKSLATFGMRGHTTVSNLCNAAQWLMWGMPHLFGLSPDTAM